MIRILASLIKKSIDILFIPVRKNRILIDYVVNHTLHDDIEKLAGSGNLFPMNHIHQSIKLSRRLQNQNFIILDIGGGIGASLKLFNESFPDNKIIVFEPVENSFIAIKNRFPHNKNIEFINAAAGNENCQREINIASRITSSSLLQLEADPDSELYNEKNLGVTGVEMINIIRLDDFLIDYPGEIGIMKLDVQGFEMEVLKGAEKSLPRTDIIVLEANNHEGYRGSAKYYDLDSYLREHNFTLYNILPSVTDAGKLKEWDVIYLNKSARCVPV